MKSLRSQFTCGALALVLAFGHSLLCAADQKEINLIDFGDIRQDPGPHGMVFRPYQYAFETWNKHLVDLPGRGVLIKAASGKGGLGENDTAVKFDGYASLDLEFLIGNANQAQVINLGLEDSDGTEQTWTIPLTGKIKGQVYRQHVNLEKCDNESKAGKKPGLNLKKINTWQIRGDWAAPNVEVLLIKLVGIK